MGLAGDAQGQPIIIIGGVHLAKAYYYYDYCC
jgi:hypothetical protein